MIDAYGSTLYASSVQWLSWRINYEGLTTTVTKNCYVKIFDPDGQLETGSSSPSGYTFSSERTLSPGSGSFTFGWGNKNATAYKPGTYRWELWYDGSKQYSASVTLQRKSGEATYLTVDSKTVVNASFESGSDYETFYVSTDADSWTTWGVPSWVNITEKTKSSFKIVCDANTSTSSRSDYMKIIAGDKEVRINIVQGGRPQGVKINSVWHEEKIEWLNKGMKIHVSFDAYGLKGHTLQVAAFFNWANGAKIFDYDGLYRATDGQVCVWGNGSATYDTSSWSDFDLFIPFMQLHMNRGQWNLKYQIQIFDKTTGQCLAQSEFIDFQYYNF